MQERLTPLKNLMCLCMALGYTAEGRHIFSTPKYSTMDEPGQIRKSKDKKECAGNEEDRGVNRSSRHPITLRGPSLLHHDGEAVADGDYHLLHAGVCRHKVVKLLDGPRVMI